MTPEEKTLNACKIFDQLTEVERIELLDSAGVLPMEHEDLQLQQILIVWFHGDIPSMNTFLDFIHQ